VLANATNHLGDTPLCKTFDSLDCARILLEAGALTNALALNGDTVLLRAVSFGFVDIVKELLLQGADHRVRVWGKNALEIARAGDQEAMVGVLESWPARLTLVVLRSAALVPRLSENSQVPKLPTGHLRMLQSFLH
jgi:hypothetical protein